MKINLNHAIFALGKLGEKKPNNQMRIGITNSDLPVIGKGTGVLFREGYYGLIVMCPVSATALETLIYHGRSEEEWFACCLTSVGKEDITEVILE